MKQGLCMAHGVWKVIDDRENCPLCNIPFAAIKSMDDRCDDCGEYGCPTAPCGVTG